MSMFPISNFGAIDNLNSMASVVVNMAKSYDEGHFSETQ